MYLATIVRIFFLLLGNTYGLTTRQTRKGRHIWGWVQQPKFCSNASTQLEKHQELFDGVFLGCGLMVNNTDPLRPSLYLDGNYTSSECTDFRANMKSIGVELHMFLPLDESAKVIPLAMEDKTDMSGIIQSSIALAIEHGWGGLNFDDESEGCPRRNARAFGHWVKRVDEWASALKAAGLKLTVDVQGMTCSACSPWPDCLPAKRDSLSSVLSVELQSNLTRIRDLLAATRVDRWITMDTYYGNVDFFKENVDWYTNWLIPTDKLGLGVCPNRECNPTNDSDTQERFDVVEQTGISRIDLWRLPLKDDADAADVWLPKLQSWKQLTQ